MAPMTRGQKQAASAAVITSTKGSDIISNPQANSLRITIAYRSKPATSAASNADVARTLPQSDSGTAGQIADSVIPGTIDKHTPFRKQPSASQKPRAKAVPRVRKTTVHGKQSLQTIANHGPVPAAPKTPAKRPRDGSDDSMTEELYAVEEMQEASDEDYDPRPSATKRARKATSPPIKVPAKASAISEMQSLNSIPATVAKRSSGKTAVVKQEPAKSRGVRKTANTTRSAASNAQRALRPANTAMKATPRRNVRRVSTTVKTVSPATNPRIVGRVAVSHPVVHDSTDEESTKIAETSTKPPRKLTVAWLRKNHKKNQPFDMEYSSPAPAPFDEDGYEAKILHLDDSQDDPSGEVLAWAEYRQELMETVSHYYNSSQAGPYTIDKDVLGVVLDKDSGDYSYMDSEIVISRLGGGAVMKDGKLVQAKSQTEEESRFKSFKATMEEKLSVMVIVGKYCVSDYLHKLIPDTGRRNRNCPVKLYRRFNVIGNYRITELFFRYEQGKSICYVRYEKFDLAAPTYLTPKNGPDLPPLERRNFTFTVESETCDQCHTETPRRFNETWVCGNINCLWFWTNQTKDAPDNLAYNKAWLQQRASRDNLPEPTFEIRPKLLDDLETVPSEQLSRFSRLLNKGIVCPKCRRCNCRVAYNKWGCETEGCGFSKEIKLPDMTLRAVLNGIEMMPTGHARYSAKLIGAVVINGTKTSRGVVMGPTIYTPTHKIQNLTFPGDCKVTVQYPTGRHATVPGGVNDLFSQILKAANSGVLVLRREKLQTRVSGQRASHFASNFGEEYIYDVNVRTTPMEDAPAPIRSVFQLLTDFGAEFVPSAEYIKPNELLALGYMEGNKMGYHDDGEKTLGPTILALSEGGPSVFRMRPKGKFYFGFSKMGKPTPNDPVLPGSKYYNVYHPWKKALDEGRMSLEEYQEKREEHARNNKRGGHAPVIAEFPLTHGTLYGMHGANFQKYYEHGIESLQDAPIRFALTARYVDPERLQAEKKRREEKRQAAQAEAAANGNGAESDESDNESDSSDDDEADEE